MMQYGNPARSISFDKIWAHELFWRGGVKICYFTPFLVPDTLLDTVDREASSEEHEYFLCIRSCYLTYLIDDLLAVEPYYPYRFACQFGFCQDLPGILISDRRVANSLAELLEFWRMSVAHPCGSVEVPCCHGVRVDPRVTLAFHTSWIHKVTLFFKRTWQHFVQVAALAIDDPQPPALPPVEATHPTQADLLSGPNDEADEDSDRVNPRSRHKQPAPSRASMGKGKAKVSKPSRLSSTKAAHDRPAPKVLGAKALGEKKQKKMKETTRVMKVPPQATSTPMKRKPSIKKKPWSEQVDLTDHISQK
ncbi:hypothetical protein H6P81_016384 [Aristolochia fimbriata]|uniref:Aminotransferase-like plant mobile domain-containing protein n=1 Tax=Aristolochia fimbriata TaxID=158543 RepID=A0AAV7E9U7_ARIFI|nr:hypothetical protein H6P81_016384 [Aristolochia fimbriata]